MISERLMKREAGVRNGFRLRGLGEVSRGELELNELEVYDTRVMIQDNVLMLSFGVLSVSFALIGGMGYALLSGMVYWLVGPVLFAHGYVMGRRKRIEQRLLSAARGTAAA